MLEVDQLWYLELGRKRFSFGRLNEMNRGVYWKKRLLVFDLLKLSSEANSISPSVFPETDTNCGDDCRFAFSIPSVISQGVQLRVAHPDPSLVVQQKWLAQHLRQELRPLSTRLNDIHMKMSIQFPELRLIQYDCGKCLLSGGFGGICHDTKTDPWCYFMEVCEKNRNWADKEALK